MTWPASFFFPHQVRVKDASGGGSMGKTHTARTALVPAEVLDERVMVRNASGQEVVSSSRVTVDLAADIRVDALVTVWPDTAHAREAKVIAVQRDENPAPLPSQLVLRLE